VVSTDPYTILDAAYRLDADAALDMLDACRCRHGAAATWEQVCRPALAAIGAGGWDGCVDVEHVLSWAITACMHRAGAPRNARTVPVLWAATAGEFHTLALEALRAVLSEQGHAVHMLGAAVPAPALVDAVERGGGPDVVVLWCQQRGTADRAALEVARGSAARVLAPGPGGATTRLPDRVQHVNTLREALRKVRN
jgi:hypothetical protein